MRTEMLAEKLSSKSCASRASVFSVKRPPRRKRRELPGEDVLGHRQRRVDGDFLEHQADAARNRLVERLRRVGRAVDRHDAGVEPFRAAENLEQGRFAGAVLADQRMNRAAAKRNGHVCERLACCRRRAKCSMRQSARCKPKKSRWRLRPRLRRGRRSEVLLAVLQLERSRQRRPAYRRGNAP